MLMAAAPARSHQQTSAKFNCIIQDATARPKGPCISLPVMAMFMQ
jgi:hypothetical protein